MVLVLEKAENSISYFQLTFAFDDEGKDDRHQGSPTGGQDYIPC
jgi:hypothetical protein